MIDPAGLLALTTSMTATVAAGIEVHFSGYVQADAVMFDQTSVDEVDPSTGEPLNEDRLLIRRARLRTEARWAWASMALELDANTVRGAAARLVAASITLEAPVESTGSDVPLLAATLGAFKIPFGHGVQERFEHRLFIDASNMVNAYFPGSYDLGGRLHGGWRFFRYQVAAMNGAPFGERAFPARDPTQNKDVIGRLGVDGEVFDGLRVQAGVSGLTGRGFHRGTPSTKDVIIWRDVNENGLIENSELQAIAGTAGTPSETFIHRAVGADLRVRADLAPLGELAVFGEVIFASNLDRALLPADPTALGRDLRERGFAIGFVQTLFDVGMIGVRFDHYDPDADARDQQGVMPVPVDSSVSTLAIAAAWTPFPAVRLIAEYDHNDNHFGRNAAGEPARLADDAFIVRAQMGFE